MDADAKKATLRMIPYGLYVLTAVTEDSVGSGTINWVSQMSFEPPLVAMGVRTDTTSFANVKAGGKLAMSFLGSGQGDLAFAFFGDAETDGDEFVTKDARIAFERTDGGAIVLTDAPAWAELTLRETVEIGDHAVVVAEVTDVGLRDDAAAVLTLSELGLNYGG
ncbi:MAG: flavin reductase family protein [Dehalococcoidia bacterium]|jgi:flavin reductase (DIM6/NTAB) family NADH-FMN oxidoreductase RutF|nr:flavin reductase family protein [Dehalococcoidia bacterium]